MAGKNGNGALDISTLENWLWDAACSRRLPHYEPLPTEYFKLTCMSRTRAGSP